MTELHHHLPLLDACTIGEKMRLLQWHLDNLWEQGWRTMEEIPIQEHKEIHRKEKCYAYQDA
jgi:hypothetical protein